MRRVGALLLATMLDVSGCAVPDVAPGQFVGSWYGVWSNRDATVHWVTSRGDDGRFQTEFLNCTEGKQSRKWTDIGNWSVSGNRLVVVTVLVVEGGNLASPTDGELKSQTDEFRIIEITRDLFRYEDLSKTMSVNEKRADNKKDLICR